MTHAPHLDFLRSACPVMNSLIEEHGPLHLTAQPVENYFGILVSTIVGQQLSAKAADTISARVAERAGEMTPDAVHALSLEDLRACGLSQSKSRAISNLAEKFSADHLPIHDFAGMPEEEVHALLIKEPGIGPWTSEMFMLAALAKEDVWSLGDAALRKAVRNNFGEDVDIDEIALRWKPYRSVASLYLWKTIDG
ncbi:DNA-3-methyladenine glycosylase II [Aurantimicrobium minutum]|uniref:DNA-3-methyladenine glycosylase family protein n=1 Tax=Aurantimicrobium minutum TaxID=708131 RepID=UPI002475E158|nr:DNA-3-methyladenine glycosylase 2 family protein [Aurantimicrobium minutum]MDH6533288.1 DNA-3-methyladenine glycosylase II [Aurantimicrobium minutum]